MAVGRKFKLKKDNTVLAGLRSRSFAYNGEPIDISSDDSGGRRKLDGATGQESVDISAEGVMKGVVLRELVLDPDQSKLLTDITLEFPILTSTNTTPAKLSGDFYISNYEESGEYNGEITFSASFQSSGDWTYTPEAV